VTWTTFLASHDVQRHKTSKRELDDMRALVARDLADAQVQGLSADRRFATAYNAALQTANMAIACAGYRVTAKTGHHRVTVDAITLAVGAAGARMLTTSRPAGGSATSSTTHGRRWPPTARPTRS
jgi:hypothetical protein